MEAGEYTIDVSFPGGATGGYQFEVLLNGQFELEDLGMGTNEALANAQALVNLPVGPLGFLETNVSGRTSAPPVKTGDAYGYEGIAVPFEFEDIASTGTVVPPGIEDYFGLLGPAELGGFEFPFYGTIYDALRVNENGFITFGDEFEILLGQQPLYWRSPGTGHRDVLGRSHRWTFAPANVLGSARRRSRPAF